MNNETSLTELMPIVLGLRTFLVKKRDFEYCSTHITDNMRTTEDWVSQTDIKTAIKLLIIIGDNKYIDRLLYENAEVLSDSDLMLICTSNYSIQSLKPWTKLYKLNKISSEFYLGLQLITNKLQEKFLNDYCTSNNVSWIDAIINISNTIINTSNIGIKININKSNILYNKYISSSNTEKLKFLKNIPSVFRLKPDAVTGILSNIPINCDKKIYTNIINYLIQNGISFNLSLLNTHVDYDKLSLTSSILNEIYNNRDKYNITLAKIIQLMLNDKDSIGYLESLMYYDSKRKKYFEKCINKYVSPKQIQYLNYLSNISSYVKNRFIISPIMHDENLNCAYDKNTDNIWTWNGESFPFNKLSDTEINKIINTCTSNIPFATEYGADTLFMQKWYNDVQKYRIIK